jgi:hypothetical protein
MTKCHRWFIIAVCVLCKIGTPQIPRRNADKSRFRWAVCQRDTRGKCRNRLMLRESLDTLPATQDETYNWILCAIYPSDCEYAIRILR